MHETMFMAGKERNHHIYRWDDEFSGEETNGRQRAVCNEGNGGERVDNGVDIGEPLKPFKAAAAKSIPERTMSAEENLDRS